MTGTDTQDLRPETCLVGETWDPKHGTLKVGPETRELEPKTRDPKVGSKYPGDLFYMGPKTRDPGH